MSSFLPNFLCSPGPLRKPACRQYLGRVGRGTKQVLTNSGLDRRAAGYYSTPSFVAEFMTRELLALAPHAQSVFDPCVGKEEFIAPFLARGIAAEGFDIETFAHHYRCTFQKADFLESYCRFQAARDQSSEASSPAARLLPHDLLIANPPYNCHEAGYVRDNKQQLSAAFAEVGVANTFAMFAAAMIDMARDGAYIGLLTCDSFLTTRMHAPLRRKILSQCALHLVALCPTDLFRSQGADVRTCLIILQKGAAHQPHRVQVANRPRDSALFQEILAARKFQKVKLADLLLDGDRDASEFVIGCPADIKRLFHRNRLGDVFECATGISTGDDRRYLSSRRAPPHTVPFLKNPGSQRFRCDADTFIDANFLEISRKVPNFIVRNQHLLFREGISCSSMGVAFGATYMPAGSLFGVNANIFPAGRDIWWLLAYLNSTLVTYFVRGVLLRTNMITSGYVSRIPIVEFTAQERRRLAAIARSAFESDGAVGDHIARIDSIVFEAAGICTDSRKIVEHYCSDLVRFT